VLVGTMAVVVVFAVAAATVPPGKAAVVIIVVDFCISFARCMLSLSSCSASDVAVSFPWTMVGCCVLEPTKNETSERWIIWKMSAAFGTLWGSRVWRPRSDPAVSSGGPHYDDASLHFIVAKGGAECAGVWQSVAECGTECSVVVAARCGVQGSKVLCHLCQMMSLGRKSKRHNFGTKITKYTIVCRGEKKVLVAALTGK